MFYFKALLLLGESHASDEGSYQGTHEPAEVWARLQELLRQVCLGCSPKRVYSMLEILHRQEDRRLRWKSTAGPMADAVANSWEGLSLCLLAMRRIEPSFRILEGRRKA